MSGLFGICVIRDLLFKCDRRTIIDDLTNTVAQIILGEAFLCLSVMRESIDIGQILTVEINLIAKISALQMQHLIRAMPHPRKKIERV